jgi:hypothetical protein
VWIMRTGAPWRDVADIRQVEHALPTVSALGEGRALGADAAMARPPVEADALLLLDSTIIKAHPHAAGARKLAAKLATERSVGHGEDSPPSFTPSSPATASSSDTLSLAGK